MKEIQVVKVEDFAEVMGFGQVKELEKAIKEKSKEFEKLKIEGIEDKKGLQAVQEGLTYWVSKRTALDRQRKKNNEGARKFIKDQDNLVKNIQSWMAPIEEDLQAKKQKIVDEKAIIEEEKKKAKEAMIYTRYEKLENLGAGFIFHEDAYGLGDFKISTSYIQTLSDTDFEDKLLDLNAERNRLRQIELKEQEEKKAEEERLEDQRKAQEAKDKEIAARQRKLDEEESRIKAEQAEKQRKIYEEAARIRKEQEEKQRKLDEERVKKEEAIAKEQAARQQRIDDQEAKVKAEQEERQRKLDEQQAKIDFENSRKKREEDERLRQIELEKAKKKAAKEALEKAEGDRKFKEHNIAKNKKKLNEAICKGFENCMNSSDRVGETTIYTTGFKDGMEYHKSQVQ